MIDGDPATYGFDYGVGAPNWIRIDLRGRYSVDAMAYQGGSNSNVVINQYRIYVTDSESLEESTWGDPVATGNFARNMDPQFVTFEPADGQYVILYAVSTYFFVGAAEIRLFGSDAPEITKMTTFTATPHVSVDGSFSVTMSATPGTDLMITGYQITTTSSTPEPMGGGWSEEPLAEYSLAPGTPEGPLTLYGWAKDDGDNVVGKSVGVCYWTTPLIPKAPPMAALHSSEAWGNVGSRAIDNNESTYWETGTLPAWLRIDLGGTYMVDMVSYLSRTLDNAGRIKDYQIYVTQSTSTTYGDWGAPAATGQMPDTAARRDIVLTPTVGRYVFLYAATSWIGGVSAAEVWIYGSVPSVTRITAFAPASIVAGPPSVGITLTAEPGEGVELVGYAVSQDSDPSGITEWAAEVTNFTIDPETATGPVTLYGYAKDSGGTIASSMASVYYVPSPVIPKPWTITAKRPWWIDLAKIIDENTVTYGLDYGEGGAVDNWVRLELGGRYEVDNLLYQGAVNNTIIKNYSIYVTDVDSMTRTDWGAPVATGTFAQNMLPQLVSFTATAGRYVILYGADCWYQWGGAEISLFGEVAIELTKMAAFSVTPHVGVGPFDVTISADPGTGVAIMGYKITTTSTPPDPNGEGWSESLVLYPIDPGTEEGPITLYGWAKDSDGTVVGLSTGICYWTTPEIPKAPPMTATSNSDIYGQNGSYAINNNLTDKYEAWYAGVITTTAYLRIDLGGRYTVNLLSVLPNPLGSRTKAFDVYITDNPSLELADWGSPVASGQFPDVADQQDVVLTPKAGQYVIVNHLTSNGTFVGAKEVWLYGTLVPAGPSVTAFTLADQSTGSTLFTNSDLVDATITAEEGAESFLVTTTDAIPDPEDPNWGAKPITLTLAGEGSVTLYAWAKNADGNVGNSASATILYSTATPVVLTKSVTDNGNGTATATWTTDIAAQGGLKYKPVASGEPPVAVAELFVRTEHSVSFAITAGVNYSIVLVNNEVESAAFNWPLAWPIDGDANLDCRVNILDLIFIRNRLNQDPATGDNWQADVNQDTRINILDLIFVRNRLNTACP